MAQARNRRFHTSGRDRAYYKYDELCLREGTGRVEPVYIQDLENVIPVHTDGRVRKQLAVARRAVDEWERLFAALKAHFQVPAGSPGVRTLTPGSAAHLVHCLVRLAPTVRYWRTAVAVHKVLESGQGEVYVTRYQDLVGAEQLARKSLALIYDAENYDGADNPFNPTAIASRIAQLEREMAARIDARRRFLYNEFCNAYQITETQLIDGISNSDLMDAYSEVSADPQWQVTPAESGPYHISHLATRNKYIENAGSFFVLLTQEFVRTAPGNPKRDILGRIWTFAVSSVRAIEPSFELDQLSPDPRDVRDDLVNFEPARSNDVEE